MRKQLIVLALGWALMAFGAHAQISVAGNATGANTFARFTLANYGGTIPIVTGSNAMVSDFTDFHPNGSGVSSGQVYGNDAITPPGTIYQVCIFNNGIQFRCATYSITAALFPNGFNLNTAQPVVVNQPVNNTVVGANKNEFNQTTPASTWTIVHNMGTPKPVVICYNTNPDQIFPDKVHSTDINTITPTFSSPQAGSCSVMNASYLNITQNLQNVVVTSPSSGMQQAISGPIAATRFIGPADSATSLVGPGSVTGNYSHGGTEKFAGPLNASLLNGTYATGTAAYPMTGAGLQAAITAAAGFGCVNVTTGTYLLTSLLTIPSNSCIYWNGSTLTSGGFNQSGSCFGEFTPCSDMVQIAKNASNIKFLGKLFINGAGMAATEGAGLNAFNPSNWTWDDIEITNTQNSGLQILGGDRIQYGKLRVTNADQNAGGSSAAIFFGGGIQGPIDPSPSNAVTNVQGDTTYVNGSPRSNCFYSSAGLTGAARNLNLQFGEIITANCGDEEVEFNTTQGVQVDSILMGATTGTGGLVIRAGNQDVNIGKVTCLPSSNLAACIDVAEYDSSDLGQNSINISEVTASGVNANLSVGAAIRINEGPNLITNVTFGQVNVDTSTRGFYCAGFNGSIPLHIAVGTLIAHDNNGDGVKVNSCNDVVISTLFSYNNNSGGTGDAGNGIEITNSNGIAIGTGRIADFKVSKTQQYGISVDAGSANILAGFLDCQDSLEVHQCIHDLSGLLTMH